MFSHPRIFCLSALAALALSLCACGPKGTNATTDSANGEPPPPTASEDISITYYGHDAFLLANDVRIAIAPHDDRIGYGMDSIKADVVLISDSDADREQAKIIEGNPEIIDKPGEHEVKGVAVHGIEAAPPEKNIIYRFALKGVKYCHLAGLGDKLSDEQVKAIGPVHVLMLPVGGGTALDAEKAWAVADQLKPKMILPMHYHTEKTKADLGLQGLDPFLEGASEPDSSGRPRALVNRGVQTMMMSTDRMPGMCMVYVLKPW